MRLKLVLITAFLAALTGAGTSIAIILGIFSSLRTLRTPGPLVLGTLLLPILTVLLAAFFVYRHTAKRRKLQAFLTAVLATFLSLCLFLVASILTARRESIEPPHPVGPSATN
jgi:cation transporter-like permease